MSEKKQDDIFPPEPYHVEYIDKDQGVVDQDAVFGEITEEGPNYRNVGWLGTTALMMKTQIGLGVLSIPLAFDTLGLIPGVIVLCAIAVITTWSDYIVGVFKLRHREVYGIDDTGALMFGYPGRVLLGGAFCLYWTFVAGSGMLGVSISLNAVSTHGACTAVFVAVAAIVGFMLASIQTLGRISWIAWVGLFGILTAIFIVTIAVGLQERPYAAPQEGVWVSDYKLIASPTFTQAITAVSSIVFAYAGTPAFFSIVSEMREPRHYTRSLVICQSVVTATYIAIGCVVYYFCGSYVASPALGSAGPTVKKISYGFALPGLLMTTLLVIHLPAKYLFIRILQGSRHLTANTMTHWVTWLGCTSGIAIIAYIIASAIPVFNDLVSLVGALLGTLMSFQPMGCMWLYDNWSKGKISKSPKWIFMVCWSGFVILSGTFLMIGGTYGSVVSIIDSYKKSGGSAAWSCADNSNSPVYISHLFPPPHHGGQFQQSNPTRDTTLTFREVTQDNWRAVANLSLKDGQTGNLAANVWSLCEAHYSEDAWVRAIYADETLVGMLMMAIWDPDEAYYIWRLMIDGRYQGLGYGRRAVEFAIAHIRQHNPRAKQLGVMSTPPEGKKSDNPVKNVKPEDSPYGFYQKLGFRQTAPPDEDGEIMMSIDM